MKEYPPEKIRNVGIIGSGTSGKTSFSEAILFKSGSISRQGNILDGNTASDYDLEEIRRGISIHSTLLPFEWKDHKVNMIDTPGYIDFVGDGISTIRVVDSLVIVIDAVAGHGAALENLWKIADKYNVPISFVRSKYDDMVNWHESTGKMKKDWIATLRNFVKKDAIKLKKEHNAESKISVARL